MRFVSERYWPGVTEAAALDATERLGRACRSLRARGIDIAFLGGTLALGDEIVTCRFDGSAEAIRLAHQRADLPIDRLVAAVEIVVHSDPTANEEA